MCQKIDLVQENDMLRDQLKELNEIINEQIQKDQVSLFVKNPNLIRKQKYNIEDQIQQNIELQKNNQEILKNQQQQQLSLRNKEKNQQSQTHYSLVQDIQKIKQRIRQEKYSIKETKRVNLASGQNLNQISNEGYPESVSKSHEIQYELVQMEKKNRELKDQQQNIMKQTQEAKNKSKQLEKQLYELEIEAKRYSLFVDPELEQKIHAEMMKVTQVENVVKLLYWNEFRDGQNYQQALNDLDLIDNKRQDDIDQITQEIIILQREISSIAEDSGIKTLLGENSSKIDDSQFGSKESKKSFPQEDQRINNTQMSSTDPVNGSYNQQKDRNIITQHEDDESVQIYSDNPKNIKTVQISHTEQIQMKRESGNQDYEPIQQNTIGENSDFPNQTSQSEVQKTTYKPQGDRRTSLGQDSNPRQTKQSIPSSSISYEQNSVNGYTNDNIAENNKTNNEKTDLTEQSDKGDLNQKQTTSNLSHQSKQINKESQAGSSSYYDEEFQSIQNTNSNDNFIKSSQNTNSNDQYIKSSQNSNTNEEFIQSGQNTQNEQDARVSKHTQNDQNALSSKNTNRDQNNQSSMNSNTNDQFARSSQKITNQKDQEKAESGKQNSVQITPGQQLKENNDDDNDQLKKQPQENQRIQSQNSSIQENSQNLQPIDDQGKKQQRQSKEQLSEIKNENGNQNNLQKEESQSRGSKQNENFQADISQDLEIVNENVRKVEQRLTKTIDFDDNNESTEQINTTNKSVNNQNKDSNDASNRKSQEMGSTEDVTSKKAPQQSQELQQGSRSQSIQIEDNSHKQIDNPQHQKAQINNNDLDFGDNDLDLPEGDQQNSKPAAPQEIPQKADDQKINEQKKNDDFDFQEIDM